MGKIQRFVAEQVENTSASLGAKIRLISAGQGSSGLYPAEMLEHYGPSAFPAGTQLFWDHLGESESWERQGNHSIKDLVGVTTSDAVFNKEEASLEASVKFFPNAADFVREAYQHFDLSIEAAAYVDDEGVVEAIIPSPRNCVVLVPKGGRDGKITALVESYREKHGKIVSNRENAGDERKEITVEPKDIEAVTTAVVEAIKPMFTQLSEALAPAPVVEESDEAEETVDVGAVAEALIEAGLPKSGRTRVLEAVKAGADIAEAIEAEKAYVEEIVKESAVEDAGTVKVTGTKGATLSEVSKVRL